MGALQIYRACLLCGKGVHTDDEFFANNTKYGWTFVHVLCRDNQLMEQQYAVLKAVQQIGATTWKRGRT